MFISLGLLAVVTLVFSFTFIHMRSLTRDAREWRQLASRCEEQLDKAVTGWRASNKMLQDFATWSDYNILYIYQQYPAIASDPRIATIIADAASRTPVTSDVTAFIN